MNHPSHHFVFQDEDARCIECDCRPGGTAAGKPCASLTDNVPCVHDSIARCEATIPWCTDCHQYIDTTTRRASTAPTLASDGKPYFPQSPHRVVAELRYDRDSGRNL